MCSIRTPAVALTAVLLLVAVASAQTTGAGGDEEPQRPLPPGWAERIDVENDSVLKLIREQVEPTDGQMQQITDLYVRFREDQMRVIHGVLREMRGETRRPRGAGAAAEPSAEERERLRSRMQKKIAEAVKPLNDKFLADCRTLLDEGRREAWDAMGGIDLMQRGVGGQQREEMKWLEPKRGPKVGDEAPPFELADLDGRKVSLKSLRGKPAVIEFGSYTSPDFRRGVESLRTLRQAYGDAVQWVLIYTFEAHASDGTWVSGRNISEGIEIPQHVTVEDRLKCAKLAKEKLKLSLPVLLDDLENRTAEAYSGHPNRGYVIDATGKVVSKQVWIKVEPTKKALDELLGRPGGEEPGQGQTPPAGTG